MDSSLLIRSRRLFFRGFRKCYNKIPNRLRLSSYRKLEQSSVKPLPFELNFDKVVSVVNESLISGLFFSKFERKDHIKSICVLESDKVKLIKALYEFSVKENIEMKFRTKQETSKITSSFFIEDLVYGRGSLDVRFFSSRILDENSNRIWVRLEFWKEIDDHYLSPTQNDISRKLWKSTASKLGIFTNGKLIDYKKIIGFPHERQSTLDIDLVFTWVNSEDKDWQLMYREYKPDFNSDATSTSRFLSRDELKFALRSWEKFGSFINKIYIVSNCKPPTWLDLENERIQWVYHESIIAQSDLPTFSSHAIETSLHKIPGLSNYFIYSNDDFLLVKKTSADNFFFPNGIAKLRLENYGNVNGLVTQGHPDYLNAARNCNYLLEKDFGKSCTQLHTHSPQSMRVDLLNEMNERYCGEFDRTRSNKFRKSDDIAVTGFLYHHYAYLTGNAIQSTDKTELIQQNHDFQAKLNRIIRLYKRNSHRNLPLSVCLNDGADSHLNIEWNEAIMSFLNEFFPEKSSFEK
ncbi:hypothetical protein BCT90_18985 [Vibrio lentus]|uniref:stealth conserved region 3 domain-containing protein n=1 Tax=Vibrio lentus TaxID=136468 RepID=UPI000C84597E|nr:stealth conserved region 3 domain-containing protein [Vibrio lentus]PMI06651.1 hypothetical protein BCU53_12190 [Vibrio lentus]PML02531.1 hypothetical protein BCT90_18985 [Vibrio lentus]